MFICLTACWLADPLTGPFAPRASDRSSLPGPPRLLPAGATIAGWVCSPTGVLRLFTAHPANLLRTWKKVAEESAFLAVSSSGNQPDAVVLVLDDADRDFLKGLA